MASGFDISILGDVELARMFESLTDKMQTKILQPAIGKGARLVKREADIQVRNMTQRISGKLRRGIQTKIFRSRKNYLLAVIRPKTREFFGIDPKDKWFYPVIVEYGHPRAAARPFMRTARNISEPKVLALIQEEIAAKLVPVAGSISQ